MNTKDRIEKLNGLQVGDRIKYNSGFRAGKTFKVVSVNHSNTKLAKTTLSTLEEGLPVSREVKGVGLANGKTFMMSNVLTEELYAQSSYTDNWEKVE